MIREIKFRAWSKERLEWLERDGTKDLRLELVDPFLSSKPRLELMQYTGLKDKNGKEIYEGDIVQWWNKVTRPQVVESTNGGWNPFIDDCTTDHPYHYVIIGNIYENPELLEVQ